MSNRISSEERFNIPKQPYNTCPDIDGLLTSIEGIGDEDEDGDIIEISPDWSSWTSAQDNVDELKFWQESWINIGGQLEDRLIKVINSIDKISNEYKSTPEDNLYYELFSKDEGDLIDLKDTLSSHLSDWKKEIKSLYYDLEYSHDSVIHSVNNNDASSANSIESYRSLVEAFRELGNNYKEIVRDNSYTMLPELCGEPSFEDRYDTLISKKEADLIDFLDHKIPNKKTKNSNQIKIKI